MKHHRRHPSGKLDPPQSRHARHVLFWRTRGPQYPIFVFGGATLAATRVLITATSFCHSFSGEILALAQ
jgi:hypothetical protein